MKRDDKMIEEFARTYRYLVDEGVCGKLHTLALAEPFAGSLWWMTVNGLVDQPMELQTEQQLDICELGDIFLQDEQAA